MTNSFDHDDLGIDLERVKALPECQACRKKSDGCRTFDFEGIQTTLCGTHSDEFVRRRFTGDHDLTPHDYATELRRGHYAACWSAKIDE